MDYASRLMRLIAAIIDLIVLIVIGAILNIAFGGDTEEVDTTASFIWAIIVFAYFFLLTTTLGASLGKMALGMRVVDESGNKPAASAIFKREFVIRALGAFAAVILGAAIGESGEAIGGLIGFVVFIVIAIMVLFDERRQGLHDKIGGTFVVKGK
jgi:uncharacterized RDD family membrane protein YckC